MNVSVQHKANASGRAAICIKIKEMAALSVGCALVLSSATAHAGWLSDTVSKAAPSKPAPVVSKVASPIRDKADELIQRAQETQATVNAVIAETDVIKSRLAPVSEALETVKELKTRFAEMAFNPADILDSPEFRDAVEMLKEKRRIAQERLSDPNVETFREDFLDTLGELRSLMGETQRTRTSALERLVANAPRTVMVLIKAAAEETFPSLQTNTRQLAGDLDELRQLRLMGDFSSESVMCSAYGIGADVIYFKALRAKKRLVKVVTALKLIATEVPFTPMKFGIHGYVEAVQIDPGRTTKDKIELAVIALEGIGERLDLVRETAQFYSGVGPCGG